MPNLAQRVFDVLQRLFTDDCFDSLRHMNVNSFYHLMSEVTPTARIPPVTAMTIASVSCAMNWELPP